ncbi:alpha/beta fold hydrolase [Caenimonas koreensis DSM 17982]|uniref:Alpha/beta fold hydrolase n=1 Tax=Caenimonas koreensis DSM 17982 TaxID=1121255 RepID=A0A844B339_9BURK|nr:alpha/beta hydrolase [Caenimonas koreensis]MRD47662.1 alpha/beta fold hydrolase [Caenimonas koreensis DSM 17982]
MKVTANGISIEVEDTGADGTQAERPVVLLIMGLGMQLVAWPDQFVQGLTDAGFRVVRFDNRDIGLSQHMDHLGVPNLMWASVKHRLGWKVDSPYSLRDMAADSIGVLDALGIATAHVVGVSMGGMIAQRVALAAPGRVASLTSIMSSSGARFLPGPKPEVLRALLSRPAGTSEEAIVDHYVKLFKAIGSPGYPLDDAAMRERILRGTRRSFHPAGTMRQMTAIAADAARADELPKIRTRTLVMHGIADPLVPLACGHDTARRIPGAQLHAIPGMGHDLPPGVVERLLEPLVPHLRAA